MKCTKKKGICKEQQWEGYNTFPVLGFFVYHTNWGNVRIKLVNKTGTNPNSQSGNRKAVIWDCNMMECSSNSSHHWWSMCGKGKSTILFIYHKSPGHVLWPEYQLHHGDSSNKMHPSHPAILFRLSVSYWHLLIFTIIVISSSLTPL